MPLSRRHFVTRLAASAGLGTALLAMQGLGLASEAFANRAVALPADHGKGKHVIVLGAGIAGLVLAYNLERAGFRVTLIEARKRTGGRNWTLRHGDKIEMIGEPAQTVSFSRGQYFNAGPARIPSHHQGLLGYCKALGVMLEVEVNFSNSALLRSSAAFDGKPIQEREAVNDFRGHISELLAKATDRGALDQELTAADREKLRAFLKNYGDLASDFSFRGTERAGYTTLPGAADQTGVARPPITLHDLLADEALNISLFDQNIVMQATMFEPVGGMDRIPAAFHRAIRSPVLLGAEVMSIRQQPGHAEVVYRDRTTGHATTLRGDYLVVTLPLPILAKMDTSFSAQVTQAIAGAVYDHSAKVAFEAPRFWEADQIYGGLSYGNPATGMVWYPSSGYQSARGILIGAYVSGAAAKTFESMSVALQIETARATVEALHPGHGAELSTPAVVNWSKVPFNLGPWIHWEKNEKDFAAYRLLNQPEGRIYFSGAHLSQLPSWQEGAVMAAHRTIALLSQRVSADRIAQGT